MTTRMQTVERVGLVAVVGLVVASAAGPVGVAYVETGSMSPTLAPGDGFVALPPVVTGPPEPGDVVVYRAREVDGGGLTTHRVVDQRPGGYVTKGDANAFTDQSAGEPPVDRDRVVAVALAVGADPVVLPAVGRLAAATRGVTVAVARPLGVAPRTVAVALAAVGAVALFVPGGRRRRRARESGLDPRLAVVACGLVLVAAATGSFLFPLSPTTYEVVAAEADVPGPTVVSAGGSETTAYAVPGGRLVPTLVTLAPASDGVALDRTRVVVPPGGEATVDARLSVPTETGRYDRRIRERRYPLVLPLPVMSALVAVHPLAPVALVDGLLVALTGTAATAVGGRVRSRGSGGRDRGLRAILGWSR
jgi:signal peptidase